MPDWKKLVHERLESFPLPSADREEVFSELATHLEETYRAACARGLGDGAAIELTLQEVEDWSVLAAQIRAARFKEGPMNRRTKALWLPGLASLWGASMLLALTQFAGFQPRLIWIGGMGMSFYWPWLAGLPVLGAVGAYLSRRAQGPTPARLVAGLFPALVMAVVMCLILPWGLVIDGFSFFRLVHFGLGFMNWVALPGLALFLGTMPFLRESQRTA